MRVRERIEDINTGVAKRVPCLLQDAVEDPHMDADVLRAAHYYVEVAQRLDQSETWRDKARPGDDVRVFDWAAGHEGDSR